MEPKVPSCARWKIAQLSWDHPDVLNATIIHDVLEFGGPKHLPGPKVSHEYHARFKCAGAGRVQAFVRATDEPLRCLLPAARAPVRLTPALSSPSPRLRYLVNPDGATAAYRLAFLLATNSVVLKQTTARSEWCVSVGAARGCGLPARGGGTAATLAVCRQLPPSTRCHPLRRYYTGLHPCEHYLPYWVTSEDDILELVATLRGNPANQLVAQRIAANGQAHAWGAGGWVAVACALSLSAAQSPPPPQPSAGVCHNVPERRICIQVLADAHR